MHVKLLKKVPFISTAVIPPHYMLYTNIKITAIF